MTVWYDDSDALTLLFQTTRWRDSNRAKLGAEQGTKQPIPPTFIKNWPIPRTFWGSTYKNIPFGFCCCSHKVDNKTENWEKPVFLMASFESCMKQQCRRFPGKPGSLRHLLGNPQQTPSFLHQMCRHMILKLAEKVTTSRKEEHQPCIWMSQLGLLMDLMSS